MSQWAKRGLYRLKPRLERNSLPRQTTKEMAGRMEAGG